MHMYMHIACTHVHTCTHTLHIHTALRQASAMLESSLKGYAGRRSQ